MCESQTSAQVCMGRGTLPPSHRQGQGSAETGITRKGASLVTQRGGPGSDRGAGALDQILGEETRSASRHEELTHCD